MGRWRLNPPAHDFIETGSSRRLFRVCWCARHHPLARTRPLDCLAQVASSLRWSYWRHSHQSAAFEAPANDAGTGYHSGRPTPCAVSLTLRDRSHVGRTLASEPARPARGSRPGSVSSALGALISGGRIQKLLLTRPGQAFPDSAPSLLPLTGKGLTPLSSLSCSRSAFSAEPRRWSASGSSVLPPGGSRRQHTFREPVELCTRLALRLWSLSPVGGLAVLLGHGAPALSPTTLPIFTTEHFPLARIRGRHQAMR